MANKRLNLKMNQKGAVSFTVIFLAMLLAFVIINAGVNFMFVGNNVYNKPFDAKYNETFTNLSKSQDELSQTINNVTDSVQAIKVQQGVLQTFWNSFQGLGAILKVPIALINVAMNSVDAVSVSLVVLPAWAYTLITLVVMILIGLTIIAAMTGGNSNV